MDSLERALVFATSITKAKQLDDDSKIDYLKANLETYRRKLKGIEDQIESIGQLIEEIEALREKPQSRLI